MDLNKLWNVICDTYEAVRNLNIDWTSGGIKEVL
jgi:hypothetical protein